MGKKYGDLPIDMCFFGNSCGMKHGRHLSKAILAGHVGILPVFGMCKEFVFYRCLQAAQGLCLFFTGLLVARKKYKYQ
jgi:hypothetical protein